MQTNTKELFSMEAEQSILGCILIDQNIAEECMSTLKVDDFYKEIHRIIFKNMTKVFNKGSSIDFVTLSDELDTNKETESIGGIEYIIMLTNVVPSSSSFRYYIDIIKEKKKLRDLSHTATSIKNQLEYGKMSDEIINKIEDEISTIKNNGENNDVSQISEDVEDEIERIRLAINGSYDEFGLATGFPILDKVLWGLQKSDLIVLGARAGVGKTAFSLNVMNHVANRLKKNTLFFSLEMPKKQIIRRLLSIASGVDNYSIKSGKNIDKKKYRDIQIAKEFLSSGKLFIDDNSSNTVPMMQNKALKLQRKQGLGLIVIDYLQFITPAIRTGNKFADIGEIARSLKKMARKLDIPIIVLAQLNRALDTEKRRPTLADLSDSSEIEKNADIVMFLHETSDANESVKNLDLIIAKHRNGEKKAIRLEYKGNIFTFNEVDKLKQEVKQNNIAELTPIDEKEIDNIF